LEVIKNEILNVVYSRELTWNAVAIAKKQVKSVLFNKVHIENPDDDGGCEFLHHFLSGVGAGTFPKKTFFELTVLQTDIPIDKEWDDCCYHQDLTDPPAHYLDNEESPIILYFAIDDQNLNLDLEPKWPKTGRPPKEATITLNPGDILLFDACSLKHRTSKPTKAIPLLHTGSMLL
jgi:hypothetical protein